MAKVTVPGPNGETVEVELDPRESSADAGWCGKHAPAKPGPCPVHDRELHELHDEEITTLYGVAALFFCPGPGCGDFAVDRRETHPLAERMRLITACGGKTSHELEALHLQTFRNAARLKILFLKQNLLSEKLHRHAGHV